jgi:hypothetical protein
MRNTDNKDRPALWSDSVNNSVLVMNEMIRKNRVKLMRIEYRVLLMCIANRKCKRMDII